MEFILHERQEGFLCAQHCLNALLQGSYFTPVDLATLGQQMDDEERLRMAESGCDTDDYQTFLKQPSGNMDDSGFFSVQVISSALKVWGLDLIPYHSSDELAVSARQNPERMKAYICNFKQHWLTIRKLGNQWFNLNSLLTGPELISDTYLGMFLAQLHNDGYSIFIVTGDLPFCQADDILKQAPAVQHIKPKLINTGNDSNSASSSKSKVNDPPQHSDPNIISDEEADIQRALNLSLGLDEYGNNSKTSQYSPSNIPNTERIVPITIEDSQETCKNERIIPIHIEGNDLSSLSRDSSDEQLQNAIKLSMEPFLSEQSTNTSIEVNESNPSQ